MILGYHNAADHGDNFNGWSSRVFKPTRSAKKDCCQIEFFHADGLNPPAFNAFDWITPQKQTVTTIRECSGRKQHIEWSVYGHFATCAFLDDAMRLLRETRMKDW